MKALSGLGIVSLIVLVAAALYLFGYQRSPQSGEVQTFPDPREVLVPRPPSESISIEKLGMR